MLLLLVLLSSERAPKGRAREALSPALGKNQSYISKGIWRQGIVRLFRKEFLCFNTMPCRHMPLLVHFWNTCMMGLIWLSHHTILQWLSVMQAKHLPEKHDWLYTKRKHGPRNTAECKNAEGTHKHYLEQRYHFFSIRFAFDIMSWGPSLKTPPPQHTLRAGECFCKHR